MDITAVKQQIKNNTPSKFYVFVGEEVTVMREYIERIAHCINVEPTYADTVLDIMPNLTSKSLLSVPQCYVIREDKDFIKSDALQDFIDEKTQNKNIIILCFYSLDKRSKLYKAYKDSIVYFERLNERILSKYIAQKIELSERNVRTLMEICEFDYGRCLLEIDKIKTFADIKGTNYDVAFQQLLSEGAIYEPPYDAIFDFIDAVLKHKVKLAYNLYQQCMDIGESNLALLSVLFSNARSTLQVQSCQSKDIAQSTGLTGFQIMKAKERCNVYTNRELVSMMRLIQKVERGIKTGEMEEQFSVEYVLINVL